MDPVWTVLLSNGVGAVIAGVLLLNVIPSMLKTFREEMLALRQQHDQHITKIVDRLDKVEDHLAVMNPVRQAEALRGMSVTVAPFVPKVGDPALRPMTHEQSPNA